MLLVEIEELSGIGYGAELDEGKVMTLMAFLWSSQSVPSSFYVAEAMAGRRSMVILVSCILRAAISSPMHFSTMPFRAVW